MPALGNGTSRAKRSRVDPPTARDIDELWDRLSRAYAIVRRETPSDDIQREIEQLRAQLERQRTSEER